MSSAMQEQKIGVFGGTFDPPHNAHLAVAERAVRQLKLDRVVFVPAYLPPHKRKGASATPSQRYTMIRKAIRGKKQFEVTSVEIERKGISYTIDTLQEFKTKYKNARLFLIVGGDNLRQFRKWKAAEQILELATLVVYNRMGPDEGGSRTRSKGIVWLKGKRLTISSTLVRQSVRKRESIDMLVPPSVDRFIRQQRLYL